MMTFCIIQDIVSKTKKRNQKAKQQYFLMTSDAAHAAKLKEAEDKMKRETDKQQRQTARIIKKTQEKLMNEQKNPSDFEK